MLHLKAHWAKTCRVHLLAVTDSVRSLCPLCRCTAANATNQHEWSLKPSLEVPVRDVHKHKTDRLSRCPRPCHKQISESKIACYEVHESGQTISLSDVLKGTSVPPQHTRAPATRSASECPRPCPCRRCSSTASHPISSSARQANHTSQPWLSLQGLWPCYPP